MGNSRVGRRSGRTLGRMHTDGTVVVAGVSGVSDAREGLRVFWVDWMGHKVSCLESDLWGAPLGFVSGVDSTTSM